MSPTRRLPSGDLGHGHGESALSGADPAWLALKKLTPARIGLGRVGTSLPTREILDFSLAHARARDAIHVALDVDALCAELTASGWRPERIDSQATDRATYLARPDLGRCLSERSRRLLTDLSKRRQGKEKDNTEVILVLADGLSSAAVARHAPGMLAEIHSRFPVGTISRTVLIARQARVALADEVGQILGAAFVACLIGERPGLSSPDSLGIYFTASPRPGRTDAERNCISNIHLAGLDYAQAATQLASLCGRARSAGGVTGVQLDKRVEIPRST